MSNSRSPRAVRSITIGIRGMAWSVVESRHDHRASLEAAGAQVGQRLFCLLERVRADRGADRDLGREREELLAVLAREIGDRADAALMPEIVVGEAGDVGHVDAGGD